MNPNEYFIKQNCPVCNSEQSIALFKNLIHTCNVLKKAGINVSNEDAPADINLCSNCKHKYLSLIIKDKFINNYYGVVDSEYYDTAKDNPYDGRVKDTKKFADLIAKKCTDCYTVLEIGSGLGHLLFQLKEKGYECTGIEPSGFASSYSRSQLGLNVITGLLNRETFPTKKFDIVILSDVIEHIYDINSLFSLIEYYLAPSGRVIVLTGNSNSLYARVCGKKWLYFYSWEHVSFFNKSSINNLFTRHSLWLDYFKETQHTGSFWLNTKTFALTFRGMLANFLRLKNHKFFYMAFDHFIAIGKNIKK